MKALIACRLEDMSEVQRNHPDLPELPEVHDPVKMRCENCAETVLVGPRSMMMIQIFGRESFEVVCVLCAVVIARRERLGKIVSLGNPEW